jgi:hypothetical protein
VKRKKRLAVAREFSRLVKLYDPRPRLTFLYSDGTGDILPADETSERWKAEVQIHAWLDAKPYVTCISRRGTSDILPFNIWRARARVLVARKRRRMKAA